MELGMTWTTHTCGRCGKSRIIWLKGDLDAYCDELRKREWA
jgi:hypothetical protein